MLNRKNAPSLKEIDYIDFIEPNKIALNDIVSFYHVPQVANETARFDLYFDAGKCTIKGGTSSFVNGLLLSGTPNKKSTEIEAEISALGGYYETGVGMESAVVSIYCLRENFKEIFDILIDAINNVTFPIEEIEEIVADKKQQFKINQEKVSAISQRIFQSKLFASNEAYSSLMNEEDFENVDRNSLIEYHKKHYLNGLTKVVLVGNIDDATVNHVISQTKPLLTEKQRNYPSQFKNEIGETHIAKEDAVQSAVRIGRILFNKKHEDYIDFLFLNTILGDYFGSRLMSNIREDKGYTYGIGSMVSEFDNTGYFMIATEVGNEVREATINEIKFEMNRLQTELVKQDEIQLIQNYLLGQLLKSADGPYAMMDLFLSAEAQNFDLDFYNTVIDKIKSISAERIQMLAKKYLNWEDMTIVTAG